MSSVFRDLSKSSSSARIGYPRSISAASGGRQSVARPTATQMAALIGRERLGVVGFLSGAIGYIVPCLASLSRRTLYVRYAATAAMQSAFRGAAPMVSVIAIPAVAQLAIKPYVTATFCYCRMACAQPASIRTIIVMMALDSSNGCPSCCGPTQAFGCAGSRNNHRLLASGGVASLDITAIFAKFAKIGALIFGQRLCRPGLLQAELVDGPMVTRANVRRICDRPMAPGPLLLPNISRLHPARLAGSAGIDSSNFSSGPLDCANRDSG